MFNRTYFTRFEFEDGEQRCCVFKMSIFTSKMKLLELALDNAVFVGIAITKKKQDREKIKIISISKV